MASLEENQRFLHTEMESNSYSRQNLPSRMIPHQLMGFNNYKQSQHQRIVPMEYQKATKALHLLDKKNIPIENTIDPDSLEFIDMEAYFLANKTLKRLDQINYMLDKLEILKNNKLLNPWLARVIITEMLYCRHQYARSMADDIETLKYYEESMRDMFVETTALVPYKSDVIFPVYVRINTLSISIDDCVRAFFKEGWNLLPRSETYEDYLDALRYLQDKNFMRDFHISELLIFPPGTIFYDHPGYLRGKFLLQDKGSCLSSFLLNPKPGSVVLDICAAPGLKTNHLANIMNNEGLIIANDDHPLRYDTLCNLLDLTNAKCVQPCQADHFNLYTSIADPDEVRYILIDPTCTYSGLFYKSRKNSSKVRLQRIRFKCTMILKYCLQTFPNLKRLVFTTCSIYPEEGERVVTDTLAEIGNSYSLLNVKEMLWDEWKDLGEEECDYLYHQYECSEKCLRTVPEHDLTPGYFIAVFERNFDVPVPPYNRKYKKVSQTYSADQNKKVDKDKPYGTIVQTYVPKEKIKVQQIVPKQRKDDSIFAKVKKIFEYQNKVNKANFVKTKRNQQPGNKYKYVSNEYKNKQKQQQPSQQQPSLQQKSPESIPQQKVQPSLLQQNLQSNSQQFPKKKSQPALVSYPILNKLKEQQFSQQSQLQYSQPKPQAQYLQQQLEPQYSQSKPQPQYSKSKPKPQYSKSKPQQQYSQSKLQSQFLQPKLQSQFSQSTHHQKLGLVSYPILNKLMSSSTYYEDEDSDESDSEQNQLYP